MGREIFVSEPRIPKGEAQDAEIIAAAKLWRDGFVTADELIEDAICRVYRPNSLGDGESGADVPGSVDVWIRLNDDGVVSDCMYDRVVRAIAEAREV